ncbi:hypothetical protein [Bradyrhizobium prioriisuperbiae]|uniref:hypothetical protein n=1 Tax=Bradyrhizobium prioriisuperbiae TaxID=2854389 RepID=UPI0028F05C42|nr:hypothetical protein [Bradyrhizobium prioritasuperba]
MSDPPKPTSQFYKDLRALDQAMSDRWMRATNDNPSRALSYDEMVDIVWSSWSTENGIRTPIFGDIRFTEKQAKAIALLMTKIDGDPKYKFVAAMRKADVSGMFFDDTAYADGLKLVREVVGTSVGRINWRSPGSQFLYIPMHYAAVIELMNEGKISAFEKQDGGLGEWLNKGSFSDEKNALKIVRTQSDAVRRNTIVHELTHAIQDWYDLNIINLYAETDALICGAVSDRVVGRQSDQGAIFDAAYAAAEFVYLKKAVRENARWMAAYKAVGEELKKLDPNWSVSMGFDDAVGKRKGASESDMIKAALRKVTGAANAGARSGSAASAGSRK